MKKLNILIVCDSVNNQIGGNFISPLRFAEMLKKRGHNVIFLASKYDPGDDITYYNGIKIYRTKPLPLPSYGDFFKVAAPTKKEIDKIMKEEKIDIVHLMIPLLASIRSVKAAKDNNVKIVAHSHAQPENTFYNFPKFFRNEFLYSLEYKYLTWLYKKAEVVICPSKFSERMLKRYCPDLNTFVISNGVDLSRFKQTNSDKFVKKFKISKEFKNILFVGRLNPEKDIGTLIKSVPFILKKEKNVRLYIVGGGFLRPELENLSKTLGVEKNVLFLGKLSDSELVGAYNSCDLFVLPSLAELEGMVVLEAMACKKPIIIANSAASASVDFVQNNGFLFDPENEVDLTKKILKLLEDPKLMKQMSKNSYNLAKNYDINESINKLEGVYYNLLKK
ncbi:D-inositol-3-phosphate glycosyltransferase [uncultured archaeon]|nr:D-inositol-3-phosphate glycosyltransferase [uncultured archaeon]